MFTADPDKPGQAGPSEIPWAPGLRAEQSSRCCSWSGGSAPGIGYGGSVMTAMPAVPGPVWIVNQCLPGGADTWPAGDVNLW